MDNKNVIAAVALSMTVLLFWDFFGAPKKNDQNSKINKQVEQNKNNVPKPNQNKLPSINEIDFANNLSRSDSINESNRITIQPSSGDKINGEVYDMDIDVERGGAQLTYSGANFGWIATEAVNSIEGTARTGKILVESNPVVTSVVNTTDSQAYFQADADEVVLTGRNIKPNSVISGVVALGACWSQ